MTTLLEYLGNWSNDFRRSNVCLARSSPVRLHLIWGSEKSRAWRIADKTFLQTFRNQFTVTQLPVGVKTHVIAERNYLHRILHGPFDRLSSIFVRRDAGDHVQPCLFSPLMGQYPIGFYDHQTPLMESAIYIGDGYRKMWEISYGILLFSNYSSQSLQPLSSM